MSTYAETAEVALKASEPERTEATETNRFAAKALEDHKREGLLLAVRARWAALAIIAVMLPFLNPTIEVLYYEVLLALFALIGWGQLKVWQVGQSRAQSLWRENSSKILHFSSFFVKNVRKPHENPIF